MHFTNMTFNGYDLINEPARWWTLVQQVLSRRKPGGEST